MKNLNKNNSVDNTDIILADHVKIRDLNSNRTLLNRRGHDINNLKSPKIQEYENSNRVQMEGHVLIKDKETGEILVDICNNEIKNESK
jgi:hypothetical protein